MITSEDIAIMGINAPRSHQRIIARLTANLYALYESGQIMLEPLPETMIDEGQTSPVPDIIFVDEQHDTVPVIIEIAHGAGVRNDIEKVRRLLTSTHYGIEEGFVYDYKRHRWYKIHRVQGEDIERPSWCNAIQRDLAAFV